MERYNQNTPEVEVQQEHEVDLALMQLQQDLQQHLQQHQQHPEPCCTAVSDTKNTVVTAAGQEIKMAGDGAAADAVPASGFAPSDKMVSEDEWHLVSPNGSIRSPSPSNSARCSFDDRAATPNIEVASNCSSDTSSNGPKDELAESILGQSMMMSSLVGSPSRLTASALHLHKSGGFDSESASGSLKGSRPASPAVSAAAAASNAASLAGNSRPASPAALEAAAPIAGNSPASSILAAGFQDSVSEAEATLDKDVAVTAPCEVVNGLGLLSGEIAHLFATAQNKAVLSLEGLKDWIMESLATIVQGGRNGHAACMSTAHSLQRSLQLAAKQGGLAGAAVHAASDWRLVLSSAAAVVCLAMWLKTRNEAATLRTMLRRRDHELSKLVMRVVSLQELLNSGQHLPITRYTRYEGTSAAAAHFM